MKVKNLMDKAHLIAEQKTTIRDTNTGKEFITRGRYDFDLDLEELDRIMNLKVNSFEVSTQGLKIWAQ